MCNQERKIVVRFTGKFGEGWDSEIVGRDCEVEIFENCIKIVSLSTSCEYGFNYEFDSYSQIDINHLNITKERFFFSETVNLIKISIDYSYRNGDIYYIPFLVIQEQDIERILNRHNTCNQEAKIITKENISVIENLDNFSGLEFEEFLKELFEIMQFTVTLTKTTGDQGVDLLIRKGNDYIAVQAKHYEGKVGNNAIQEAVAGAKYYGANKSMVVTNSYFTQAAIELSKMTETLLWDKNQLVEMIKLFY